MKLHFTTCFPASLLLIASLSAAPIVDETFEYPTELTLRFPPQQGEETIYHGKFSGWSSVGKGVMAITYGAGLGKDKSGGMLCTAEKLSPDYNVVQYGPFVPDFGSIADVTIDKISRLVLAFDANIPAGKILQVVLNPTVPEDMRARVYPSRLVLGRVTGTGKFERYTLSAGASLPVSLQAFTQLLKDAGLNGMTEAELTAVFLLERGHWADGDSFQFDNLQVSLADPAAVKK
jgi:hypothetical protein